MQFAKNLGRWLLAIFLSLSFIATGIGKFSDPSWVEQFTTWGYPAAMVWVVGALEILAALALLIPRLTTAGAGTLCVVMVGALLTHAVHGNHPGFPAAQMATFYLVLSALLAWAGWPRSILRGLGSDR